MLNILFINAVAERGGAETILQNIVTNLNPAKFRPVVVFLRSGSLVEEFRTAGITTYVIEAGRYRQLWHTAKAVFKIRQIIKREQINLIHNNGLKAHVYGGFTAFLSAIPVILHLHDFANPPRFWEKLSKSLPISLIICPSEDFLAKATPYFYPIKVVTIYGGSDASKFYPAPPSSNLCKELALAEGTLNIAIFARLQHWKGLHNFIETASLVHLKAPHTRFFIIGGNLFNLEPGYVTKLEKQIEQLGSQNYLQLLGHRSDIPDLMRAMDIIVNSSILPETFGLVLVEAMLSGKAVVATSIGGPTEIVKDQLTGFLVPPNQPNIMANRILELVGNPELRAEFGSNGRQLALKKFTVTTMLEKIEFYYQELGQTISPPANNLCFISGEFPPQVGGVGDYTYQVARALDQQKKNVTILTRQTKREAVIEGGISLNIVPVISQANLDFRTVFRLLNYFGKNRFETVFYQYVPQMYGYAGINLLSGLVPLVARLAGIKKVVTVFHEVSTRPKDSPNRLKGTVMWAFQSLQATLLALTSQHLITNNPENGERLNRLLRNFGQSKRCEVLPVGSNIPLTKFARTNRDTLRESVGVAPHQTLLVIFSPFTIGKDLETCLQALKQLPGAKLLCIGGKADKTLASTLIQKAKVLGVQAQLHLISGPLAGETVSAWLQACDIYLHPGDGGASGRSTALAAAMQHALPVVAYCGAETDSSFRDGENICLIPPKEVKAMVKAIENLQQNKNFARNLASNAAHYYREKADWSVIAKRLNTLIES